MEFHYSSNRNVQMLISVLKANNIKKIVVSPGTTHICFIGSVQQDDYFELYSEVDERGAAYMACGLAMESGEPVVITCTGATASRNYLPGLSEAFYRKLPIIALTGSQDISMAGHLSPQFIDRSVHLKDVLKLSVHLQNIKDEADEWDCNVKINKAVLECIRHGGGPVHINMTTYDGQGLVVKELPPTRIIRRYADTQNMPEIPNGKIAITVGAHKKWDNRLTDAIDRFCAEYDAVVFVDHSSNYHGKYRVLPTIVTAQEHYQTQMFDTDLLIHIGEQSGDYYTYAALPKAKEVWRVSEDGEIRDTFKKLTNIFEMPEHCFFEYYAKDAEQEKSLQYSECINEIASMYEQIPELPLSNIWIAKQIAPKLPEGSMLQLGVSNTMRSWTFFEIAEGVESIANIGCRGIDGTLSSAIGMSQINKERLYFCVLGDLTFFYNMNALGNRNVGNNLRVLLINNGTGMEFHNYTHRGKHFLGDAVDSYVAAGGHFGNKSKDLVRHYVQDLGFEYLSASTKEKAEEAIAYFTQPEIGNKPLLLEIFTDCNEENIALKLIRNIKRNVKPSSKETIKGILGEKGTRFVKNIIKK